MKNQLWPVEVSGRLTELLADAFNGVHFQTSPLVAYDVTTLDVAWTDGPPLHEVDSVALGFVLRLHLDAWGTPLSDNITIDRISKRRAMSPAAEEMLMRTLAAELGTDLEDMDMERIHPLPPVLASSRYRAQSGTIGEFLDQLFEATSFSGAPSSLCSGGAGTLLCRCSLCG